VVVVVIRVAVRWITAPVFRPRAVFKAAIVGRVSVVFIVAFLRSGLWWFAGYRFLRSGATSPAMDED
jgi:hypothetical protein